MNKKYKKNDFCYIVDNDNRIKFCQILKVIKENRKTVYQVQDQVNWRFSVIEHKFCADSKKELSGIKRMIPKVSAKK